MATYDGEKYIRRQIDSILTQLTTNDELVISDDNSTDNTVSIIESYNDKRIKLIAGPQKGFVKNFENAVANSNGDIIFLSDQDDYWYDDKVSLVLEKFNQNNCLLVEHDARVIDVNGNEIIPSFFRFRNVKDGVVKNIIKCGYHGCLMAFRKELIPEILPFPKHGCFHDQWIGLVADYNGEVCFVNKPLMDYIRHSDNVSGFKKLSFYKQVYMRLTVIYYLCKYLMFKWGKGKK